MLYISTKSQQQTQSHLRDRTGLVDKPKAFSVAHRFPLAIWLFNAPSTTTSTLIAAVDASPPRPPATARRTIRRPRTRQYRTTRPPCSPSSHPASLSHHVAARDVPLARSSSTG